MYFLEYILHKATEMQSFKTRIPSQVANSVKLFIYQYLLDF